MIIRELDRIPMSADKINYVIFSEHYERCDAFTINYQECDTKEFIEAVRKVWKYKEAEVSTITAVDKNIYRISAISKEL